MMLHRRLPLQTARDHRVQADAFIDQDRDSYSRCAASANGRRRSIHKIFQDLGNLNAAVKQRDTTWGQGPGHGRMADYHPDDVGPAAA